MGGGEEIKGNNYHIPKRNKLYLPETEKGFQVC